MKYITFTDGDGSKNEVAFNELHARIMASKGLPYSDGITTDWAAPILHPTNPWCAMKVDDDDAECMSALTSAEKAILRTRDELVGTGWFPSADAASRPWWDPRAWWI